MSERKTSLKVVPLAREPWPSMVDYLREKLAQAERGEITGCLVMVEYADGGTGWRAFHGTNSIPIKLVGELELAKLAMLQREAERRDEKGWGA